MAHTNRTMKILDQLPKDLTLDELQELQSRFQSMQAAIKKAEAELRRSAHAASLALKFPGLQTLLDSGRAKLGEPKTPGLYAPTGFRLPPGLTSRDLLDLDREES